MKPGDLALIVKRADVPGMNFNSLSIYYGQIVTLESFEGQLGWLPGELSYWKVRALDGKNLLVAEPCLQPLPPPDEEPKDETTDLKRTDHSPLCV